MPAMDKKLLGLVVMSAATGIVAGVGCETQNPSNVAPQARHDITFAATAHYPGNAINAPDRVQATAVVNDKMDRLEIYNPSDRAIPPATLWVNGLFVHQLATIPPKGMAAVDKDELLQAGPSAMSLTDSKQAITKVELQTSDGLYTVQGPAMK